MGRSIKNLKRRTKIPKVKRKIKSRFRYITPRFENETIKKQWNPKLTMKQNYEKIGLVFDANKPEEVNPNTEIIQMMDIPEQTKVEDYSMTEVEIEYIETLIKRHGENTKKMFKDLKLNFNQLTENQLIHKIERLNKLKETQNDQAEEL